MENEIVNICNQIKSLSNPELIILFGKKNNIPGDNLREISLCVVVSSGNCRWHEKNMYLNIKTEIACNFIVYTFEEWKNLKEDHTSYAGSIEKKGVVVYEKTE